MKRMKWRGLAVISLLVAVGIVLWWDPFTPRVCPLPTPAWDWGVKETKDVLFLRREEDSGGSLLLLALGYGELLNWESGMPIPHVEKAVVYRYTPGTSGLAQVGIDTWEKAKGNICDSETHCLSPRDFPAATVNNHTLLIKGRRTATAARLALNCALGPDKNLIAVCSVSGPYFRGSMFILLGPGYRIYGKRYHQILRIDDAAEVGARVILQGISPNELPAPMWTADGKYVVYSEFFPSPRVWIVAADGDPQAAK